MKRSIRAWGLLGTFVASTAMAEDTPSARPSTRGVPRTELGVQVGPATGTGGPFVILAGSTATLNVTDRSALEAVTDIAALVEDAGVHGLYSVQFRRALAPTGRHRRLWFWTLGTTGGFRYLHSRERRYQRGDGSTLVQPAYTSFDAWRPALVTTGLGVRQAVGRYAAFRADLQALVTSHAATVRVVGGVTVPLGGAYAWP